ncbi:type I restriction enzyme, S subunit [Marinobacter sp. DSM 26671]|jgi:type I restriction enzyme S subunit|uniref:restriction endonuclease subunit S n=1 Tax=Marinobacter sp. DSM 26671 TaxID=1761793 RepID=UPI0008DF8A5D|nr:restriction endonuclease subunit S [Marinobacter sp. DSM 26671]SFE57429.1 type I restriction enzyme, S subunit [Marinobacter sp. DSM 26671]
MTGSSMPSEWHKTTLGTVAQWGSGGTPSRKNREYYGGDVPWVKTGDLGPKVLSGASEYITGLGLQKSSAKYFPKGSVVIAMYGATIGKTSILGFNATTNQACAVGQPVDGITDTTFLYYLLRNEKDAFIAKGKGGAQPNISQALIKEHGIALPPLAEQKVIANKLDTLLAQVENTKARLERIPQILKRFRQSVLAAAVSGRLTEEWRPHSGSYVHSLAEDWKWTPVPETWEVKLYPDLVESRLGKMLDKAKNSGLPTKYLGNINVRWFDFNLSEVQEILVSEAERNELSIRAGDVLICEGGEPGRCAIWDGRVEEQMVFQKALHRARVSDALLPEWLALNLKHDADSLTLEQLFTGTTIKHLTGKALKKYPLRVPPIKEQTEIVRRVDQLLAHADRIEQQVNNALARVNNLTQSILAKAFRGELTEQWRKDNPELISGENSAEALLERVQAERAAMKPVKKTRSKPTTV